MPRLIPLVGVSLAILAFAAQAVAGDAPNAANLSTQQQSRSITIRNLSGTAITQARVQTTDGRVWNVGNGAIPPNEGSEVVVPATDCLANITVQLDNGRMLQLPELHSCHDTNIVVRKDAISIPQVAVPGAKQHGTPG